MKGSAADQLARLLYLLPAAARGDLSTREAAERLRVDEETILADLADVTAREYYHPAGGADDLRVEVDAERIRVEGEKFRRPPRLNTREALAAHLALRRYAAGLSGDGRESVLRLAERVGRILASASPQEDARRIALEEESAAGFRLLLQDAAREGTRLRMVYLRPAAEAASERDFDPYAVVGSHGSSFAIGYCGLRKATQVFRVDRILELGDTGERFEAPADFDAADYVDAGRVFRAEATREVRVRYRGTAATRMREWNSAAESDGADTVVRYDVADTDWLIRHVLQHGGMAEVESPPDVRAEVAAAATDLASTT
jgi:predicted DNA-binding transcriptional regulator YafY